MVIPSDRIGSSGGEQFGREDNKCAWKYVEFEIIVAVGVGAQPQVRNLSLMF
jgi:hypothetical protein